MSTSNADGVLIGAQFIAFGEPVRIVDERVHLYEDGGRNEWILEGGPADGFQSHGIKGLADAHGAAYVRIREIRTGLAVDAPIAWLLPKKGHAYLHGNAETDALALTAKVALAAASQARELEELRVEITKLRAELSARHDMIVTLTTSRDLHQQRADAAQRCLVRVIVMIEDSGLIDDILIARVAPAGEQAR